MSFNAKKLIAILILSSVISAGLFAQSGEIVSAKGKVEVSRGSEWIPLKVGDKVNQSDVISTGFQSEAKIKMGDSILQLGALSRVTIATLATNDNKEVVDVYLNTGAVRSKVNHTSDKKVNYTVRNPIAVASVRGTEFTFVDDGTATCTEGAIALAPAIYYDLNILASEKSIDEVESPADGESDVTTPATDIAPDAPKGSIVVLAGQSAVISSNGTTTTPYTMASNSVQKAASTVTTAAASEKVSASVFTSSSTVAPTAAPIIAPTTGSLDVTVDFE